MGDSNLSARRIRQPIRGHRHRSGGPGERVPKRRNSFHYEPIMVFLFVLYCLTTVESNERLIKRSGRQGSGDRVSNSAGFVGEWWRKATSGLSPSYSSDKHRQHQDYDDELDSNNYEQSTSHYYYEPKSHSKRLSPMSPSPPVPDYYTVRESVEASSPSGNYYPLSARYGELVVPNNERIDYYQADLRGEEDYEHRKEIEHHHKEVKEISYVYPVLLALLILGALFVPFISLFFFLSVSAFNCQSGLSQVTPLFGRRRRRRKRQVGGANRTLLAELNEQESKYLEARAKSRTGDKPGERVDFLSSEDLNLLMSQLPLSMLFDSSQRERLASGSTNGSWVSRASNANKTIPLAGDGGDLLIQLESALLGHDLGQLRARLAEGTRTLWRALANWGDSYMMP